jgi:hypothetical protein
MGAIKTVLGVGLALTSLSAAIKTLDSDDGGEAVAGVIVTVGTAILADKCLHPEPKKWLNQS